MAGRIPESVIDEVSRRTDILDVIGSYVQLDRKGNRWWGLCPFHDEKTPSFSVAPENNMFYCFGCHKGGSSFQFVMEMESINFPDAVRRLAEKAGVDVPNTGGETDQERDNRKALDDLYRRVSQTFRWLLVNHPGAEGARTYLEDRGISPEIAEVYRIGWAPDEGEWLYRFLLDKKYSPAFLAESGLFSRKSPRWSYFVDRLMFPVMPDAERVVAFSGRALSDRGPKYINSPETSLYRKSRELYGQGPARDAIRKGRRAVLCEGNLDVLSLYQSGITDAVAPLGTAFTPEQAKLIKRSADSVVLVFDGDAAGRAATLKAAVIAEEAGLAVQAVRLPDGRDPSDIMVADGEDSLKKVLGGPINIFRYLLDSLISAHGTLSGEAQEEALEELTPYLAAVGSEVRREAYIRDMADAISADPHVLLREFRRRKDGISRTQRRRPDPTITEEAPPMADLKVTDELFLMAAVVVKPEYFSTLQRMLAPEMIRDGRALAVYRVLEDLSRAGDDVRTESVLHRLDDEPLKGFILEKAASEVYSERAEETIKEKARLVAVGSLEIERSEVLKELSRGNAEDPEIQEARLARIREIDREIMRIRQGEDGGNQD